MARLHQISVLWFFSMNPGFTEYSSCCWQRKFRASPSFVMLAIFSRASNYFKSFRSLFLSIFLAFVVKSNLEVVLSDVYFFSGTNDFFSTGLKSSS